MNQTKKRLMNDGLMYSAAAIHTFGIPLGWRTPEEPFFFLGTICFISSYSRNCFSASPGFFWSDAKNNNYNDTDR